MCGIAGIVPSRDLDPAQLERWVRRMCQSMVHRGPDDEDVFIAPDIGIGVRRLAIIDIENGRQPMHSSDGRHGGFARLARCTARCFSSERPLGPRGHGHDSEFESPRRGTRRVGHLRARRPDLGHERAAADLDASGRAVDRRSCASGAAGCQGGDPPLRARRMIEALRAVAS